MTPEELAAQQAAAEQAARIAASDLWLQQNRPDLINPQRTAEQAAAANLAYQTGNYEIPSYVLAAQQQRMQETYTVYDFSGMNEWQRMNQDAPSREVSYAEYVSLMGRTPDESEMYKHNIAFHPGSVDPSTLPADLRESYYGEMTDRVHEYYRQNPSPEFLALTGMYGSMRNSVVTGGGFYANGRMELYDPSGFVGFSGRAAAYAGSWQPLAPSRYANQNNPFVERTETVPTRQTGEMATWQGRTFFVPYGERTQQELLDAKGVYDPVGGRIGIYQVPPSIFEQAGGFKRVYGWETAGGSTGALQSGMFSIGKPLTADVRTQWSPDTYSARANQTKAALIRATPAAFSRMGAEAYGGIVSRLDNRVLSPDTQMGRYDPATGNLANLVDPYGVNRPKSELQATEPWRVDANAPVLQTMSGSGIRGTALSPLAPGEYAKVGIERLIGGKTIAGDITRGDKPPGTTTTRIEAQHFALPFIGEVPVISPLIEQFLPEKIITTRASTEKIPDKVTQRTPYTIGDTTYYETVTESGLTVNKEETTTYGLTPFTRLFQGLFPAQKQAGTERGQYLLDNPVVAGAAFSLMGSKPQDTWLLAPKSGERLWQGLEGPVKFAQSLLPGSTEWREQTIGNIREDPALGLISGGIALAFIGAGTAMRSAGAGTTWLKAGTKSQAAYSAVSTAATAGLAAIYGNDVLRRTTGMQIGDVTSSVFIERNPAGILDKMKKNWVGWETATKQTNRVLMQELGPMYAVHAAVSPAGFKISDWAITRGKPEVKGITRMAYTSDEGFATNAGIRTGDLVDSFLSGTITMRNPAALSRTKMAPDMGPINRIPVGTQIGAAPGKSFIFSGAEYPHLQAGGSVGESFSEVTQAMYTSPVGYSYFTKPGAGQGGFGFGITNDIFSLYSQPTLYRLGIGKGEHQLIPDNLLRIPTEGKSLNDPMNPRNLAISKWMAETGEYGKPIIGQYGKSEWQYLIRTGTEVKSSEPVGWFRDAGRRVTLQDAVFGGKAKGYKPRTQFEIGKFYAGTPAESSVSSGIARSGYPMVSPAVTSLISSRMKIPDVVSSSSVSKSSRTGVTSSSISRPSSKSHSSEVSSLFSSRRGSSVSKPSSDIYPSSNLYPSSLSYPSSSKSPSSSKQPDSSRSSSKSSTTLTPRVTITTTPKITTTTRPTSSTTSTPRTDRTFRTDITTTTTKIPGGFSLPGGGGGGGGYLKGRRAYVEMLGFETSRYRKGAINLIVRKMKKKGRIR